MSIEQSPDGSIVFSGTDAVNVFRCEVIASALRLYAKSKMQVNRAYTPTAMLRAAEQLTGCKFKRGQYHEAADALEIAACKARDKDLGR